MRTTGWRFTAAACAMVLLAQVLAIANDVILRQSDPSDVVLLFVLIVLSVLMLRRIRWARWTMIVLVALGGVLQLAGAVLLIAAVASPGFWGAAVAKAPVLAGLNSGVLAFTASSAFPLLTGSVIISGVLELVAVAMLIFTRSVGTFFLREAATPSA